MPKKILHNLKLIKKWIAKNGGKNDFACYKPSFETPDYESAAKVALPDDFDLTSYETITINTRWKDVCAALGLNVPPGKEKPARVIIK